MGELGGAQKYLYWANRRVLQWLEDSNVGVSESSQWKWTTPNFGSVLPTIEVAPGKGRTTKTKLASSFQRSFGQRIVSDLSSPAPIGFAKGEGKVTFGEFVSPAGVPQRALMYASVPITTDDGEASVAVCLFGSLENYADFVIEAGTQREHGWTSSSARDIEHFLTGGKCEDMDICESSEDVARAAVRVCCRQGQMGSYSGSNKGYNRQFTYGETKEVAEWCAEIYLDVDLSDDFEEDHSRVLVGAPLWVRTPSLRGIHLYSDYTRSELDGTGTEGADIDRHSFGERLKKAIRVLRGSEM